MTKLIKAWTDVHRHAIKSRRKILIEAVHAAKGNISEASRRIGITSAYAWKLIKAFGLVEVARKLRVANGLPRGAGRPPRG